MTSIPPPTTQSSAPSRSWRQRVSMAVTEAILQKQRSRTDSSRDHSRGSGESRDMSTATMPADQEDGAGLREPHRDSNTTAASGQSVQKPPVDAPRNPMERPGEGGVEYTSLKWWQCGMCMVAETISLGILALPKALADLGLVAGLILLLAMGALASYSGYIIGQFKLKHPDVHNMGHAGRKLFGKIGGHLVGFATLGFIVFIMGAHILTFRLMMDVLTDNKHCGIIWTVVGLVVSFIACLPRTMKKMSYLSAASFASIIGAVLVTVAAIIKEHPGAHPENGHLYFEVRAWPKPGLQFHDYFNSLTNIVFAYAGHVAFFAFISELRNPRDFNKSLAFLQISDISMYIFTAVIIYIFAGDGVKSPALNSASELFSKIAYGIASITIIIAGVVNGHIAIKTTYVALNKKMGGQMMHEKTLQSIGIWFGITGGLWILAWVLAELIPVFNAFVGLTGALFASWFTFGFPALFWGHMNLGEYNTWFKASEKAPVTWTWRNWVALGVNVLLIMVASVIFVAGTYASVKSIISSAKTAGRPFSCKHVWG